jgi:hypothetical protein
MGLFDRLGKLFQGKWLDDPLFGRIRFQSSGFWEGHAHFRPAGKAVEVLIDGGEEGPTEKQREFFRDLEARYPQLAERLGDVLLRELASWTEKEYSRAEVWNLFTLAAISIPDPRAVPLEWELTYETSADGHSFDVAMRGFEPEGVTVNG